MGQLLSPEKLALGYQEPNDNVSFLIHRWLETAFGSDLE